MVVETLSKKVFKGISERNNAEMMDAVLLRLVSLYAVLLSF